MLGESDFKKCCDRRKVDTKRSQPQIKYCYILLIYIGSLALDKKITYNYVIASYHTHGECEQYHSELKTDMDVERLPSEKFATNALVLELAKIVFKLLRMIGQESLK